MQIKFENRIEETLGGPLTAGELQVFQVNAGYRCNMVCRHSHVVAGPNRSEVMEKDTVAQVLAVPGKYDIKTLDLHMQDPYSQQIRDFDIERLAGRPIRTGNHCYGRTAGQGST